MQCCRVVLSGIYFPIGGGRVPASLNNSLITQELIARCDLKIMLSVFLIGVSNVVLIWNLLASVTYNLCCPPGIAM